MYKNEIEKVIEALINYIEKEQFKGYDPYDTLNSWLPFHWFGKLGQALAIQIQKLNPINIRLLMGIKRDYNPKGLGLLLQSYCLLYEKTNKVEYINLCDSLFKQLLALRSPDYNNYCWGYNFVWASTQKVLPKYYPSIVVTSFVGIGIFKYYVLTKNEVALQVLKSIQNYIMEDIPLTTTDEGVCFSYTDYEVDCCYNASMLGVEILSMIYSITKEEKIKKVVEKAVNFVLAHQHPTGKWNYSMDLKTQKEREQIDFHQGFVLVSLYHCMKYAMINNEQLRKSIEKGLHYYKTVQFFDNGQSLWRVPKSYPVDIHNQAQGIITFSLLKEFNKEYFAFACKIVDWTIHNMQDNKGYFYYRKFKYYINKIPYIRWSQAWMLLALITYINNSND